MDPLLTDLLAAVDSSSRPLDKPQIQAAWEFAHLAHTSQKRKSGHPFISHPTEVAKTLISWHLDTDTIIAGLLHDTIEDGGATREDLVKKFGENIALLVDGVTKISDIHLTGSTQDQFVENLRKMILVMARDLRVVLIKLADRVHNMQTLHYLVPEKRLRIARETLEIYAPLAERLGMGEIKGLLEDLAFKYAYPDDYEKLVTQTKDLFKKGEVYIVKFRRDLLKLLTPLVQNVVVNIRHKHIYSLWRKLHRPENAGDLGKIHDLVAARVITDTPDQCYIALGIIHGKYHPVPYLGVSDFIANPKPNGYQSLHTKVFGPEGRIVEIQIRTHKMHQEAEMGVAAHWQYSESKSTSISSDKLDKVAFAPKDKLAWVKQLAAWQQEMSDNGEYLQSLKFDALQHRNLVFSPIGDVYDLPRGGTPIDYAYAVHTDLCHQAIGAKVNGKMVSLDYKLNNGDVVEILIDRKRTRPNSDWLGFVVTTAARREISKSIKS